MCKGDRDLHVEYHRHYPKCDLKDDESEQPIQTIPDVNRTVLPASRKIKNSYCDQYYKRKPAMDEDDGLRRFKDVDKGVEKIRRDEFPEHEGPRIRNMTSFEAGRHAAICNLNDQ